LGWQCAEVNAPGGDLVFACVPKFKQLCDPCATHDDCVEFSTQAGNRCIDYGPKGKYCAAQCEVSTDCPPGYDCLDTPVDGAITKQCIPVQGDGSPRDCSCSPLAMDLGKQTSCYNTSDYGTCYGYRACQANGLTECTADFPGVEICNGLDDNCDGQFDNITTPESCEVKNEFGSCVGVLNCDSALGTGTCDAPTPEKEVCDGKDNNCDSIPDNGFENTDGDEWADCVDEDDDNDTFLDDEDNCPLIPNPDQANNDGDHNGGDACDPDDDNDDTPDVNDCAPFDKNINVNAAEICDGKDNDCDGVIDENLCDDGNLCTIDKCQSDGSCVHQPIPLECDDGNPCTNNACNPATGQCKTTNNTAPCDDGNLCTNGDQCLNGSCKAGAPLPCDDGNPCTSNLGCSPLTGCQYQNLQGAFCNTNNGTCPQGTCSGGQCFIQAGQTCTTKVGVDLCQKVTVAGQCTTAGKCVASSAPAGYTCPGCAGICIKCFGINVCIPF